MALYREMRDASRYGYAWGRLSARKARAVSGPVADRMIAADTFHAAVTALEGTPFARPLSAVSDPSDARAVQAAIDEVVSEAYRFTAQAGLPEAVQRMFRIRYDFENARAAVKAHLLGVDASQFTSELGSAPAQDIVAAIAAWPEVDRSLPAHLQQPLRHIAAMLAKAGRSAGGGTSPVPAQPGGPNAAHYLAILDTAFDQALFGALTVAAAETGNDYVRSLARLEVDLANIKMLTRRSRVVGRPAHRTAPVIPGGTLSERAIRRMNVETVEDLLRHLVATGPVRGADYRRLLSPASLDLELAQARMRAVAAGERMDVGLEPLVAYVSRIEAEARLVRAALIGVTAGLVPEDVDRAAQETEAAVAARTEDAKQARTPADSATAQTADRTGQAAEHTSQTAEHTAHPDTDTRSATHRIAVVGDSASAAVLASAGAVAYQASTAEEARAAWGDVLAGGYAVVFVTEPLAGPLHNEIDLLATSPTPAVTIIPSLGSPGGMGAAKLARAVERALGSAVGAGAITGTTQPQRTEQ